MNPEHEQKKVGFWSIGFVVGILVLAALIAAGWYYLRGRKTNRETPQQQSRLLKWDTGLAAPAVSSNDLLFDSELTTEKCDQNVDRKRHMMETRIIVQPHSTAVPFAASLRENDASTFRFSSAIRIH